MPFALRAKDHTWDGCNVRFIEKDLRRVAALLVNLLGIRKCVEGAGGRLAIEADGVEALDDDVAALAVLFATCGNVGLGRGERLKHCMLHKSSHAIGRIENDFAEGRHE